MSWDKSDKRECQLKFKTLHQILTPGKIIQFLFPIPQILKWQQLPASAESPILPQLHLKPQSEILLLIGKALLGGIFVIFEIKMKLKLEKEQKELDVVWYMALLS